VVERDTGIGKDTLRVWERRYGFPRPVRDASGDRLYPAEQVERLRLIRRLIDVGHRPGRLVGADDADLAALASEIGGGPENGGAEQPLRADSGEAIVGRVIGALIAHDVEAVRRLLSTALTQGGLERFVLDMVPALNVAVGEAWGRGALQVFEEHLYTELLQKHLRQAIAGLPPGTRPPRILLTTVPEEQHALGILMLEALYTMNGASCVSLGTQTPIADMVAAARAHGSNVLALSFSAAFPPRQVVPVLQQLRSALPPSVALWVGGSGVQKISSARRPLVSGVDFGVALEDALALLANWTEKNPH
jgi:methanogenic corrinoid protein MtbC1